MLFKDTKAGYPVYLLDKEQTKATQGKVISVSAPRVQTPQGTTFAPSLTASLVVDVTIEAEGTTRTYTIPETSALAYAGLLVLSTDKEGILREVQALKTASEDALSKIAKHEQTIAGCNKVLEEWDTAFAEKRKTDERITGIETAVQNIGKQLKDFIDQFKA